MELIELRVSDDPDSWADAGFVVADGAIQLGGVAVRPLPAPHNTAHGAPHDAPHDATGGDPAGRGILGWTLAADPPPGEHARPDDLDGLATCWVDTPRETPHPSPPHPNGITRIDHLVIWTDSLPRTLAALEPAGIAVRRTSERRVRGATLTQAFCWAGSTIVEVVCPTPDPATSGELATPPAGEPPPGTPPVARFWGMTLVSPDLDATASWFGDRAGPVTPAVQPGRRITTLATAALGIGTRLAVMSPHLPR